MGGRRPLLKAVAGLRASRHLPGAGERGYYERKLALARFYVQRILPETAMLRQRAMQPAADMMALAAEDL